MSEKLNEAISNLINKSAGGADKASDFLAGEIPLYVQELLMWHGWFSFIYFLFGASVLAFYVWLCSFPLRKYILSEDSSNDDKGSAIVVSLFIGLFVLVCSLIFVNFTWLQVWIAPRVFLVEYASKLVGG